MPSAARAFSSPESAAEARFFAVESIRAYVTAAASGSPDAPQIGDDATGLVVAETDDPDSVGVPELQRLAVAVVSVDAVDTEGAVLGESGSVADVTRAVVAARRDGETPVPPGHTAVAVFTVLEAVSLRSGFVGTSKPDESGKRTARPDLSDATGWYTASVMFPDYTYAVFWGRPDGSVGMAVSTAEVANVPFVLVDSEVDPAELERLAEQSGAAGTLARDGAELEGLVENVRDVVDPDGELGLTESAVGARVGGGGGHATALAKLMSAMTGPDEVLEFFPSGDDEADGGADGEKNYGNPPAGE